MMGQIRFARPCFAQAFCFAGDVVAVAVAVVDVVCYHLNLYHV